MYLVSCWGLVGDVEANVVPEAFTAHQVVE